MNRHSESLACIDGPRTSLCYATEQFESPPSRTTFARSVRSCLATPTSAADKLIHALEHAKIRRQVEQLKRSLTTSPRQFSGQHVASRLADVVAMTREVFQGDVSVEVRDDPEIANETYFTLCAAATGSVDEIVDKHREWHRRIVRIAQDMPGLFRLTVDAREQ